MPSNKQPKITAHISASKQSQKDKDGAEDQQNETPMDDCDVHTKSTSGPHSNTQESTSPPLNSHPTSPKSPSNATNQHHEGDDATVIASNDPSDLQYTRCDLKISIKGTTEDYYLEALQQIQILHKHLQKEDEFIRFAPWKDNSLLPNIVTPKEIPRRYGSGLFQRVKPPR